MKYERRNLNWLIGLWAYRLTVFSGLIGKFVTVGACCARPGRMQYAPTNNTMDLSIGSLNLEEPNTLKI